MFGYWLFVRCLFYAGWQTTTQGMHFGFKEDI